MLRESLASLPRARDVAVRTLVIVRQNLRWAVIYNMTALPLAAIGLMPPSVAALGMSLSSLLVGGLQCAPHPACITTHQRSCLMLQSIYLLIPLSILLLAAAIWAFFWAVNRGQFDDMDESARAALEEDPLPPNEDLSENAKSPQG